MSAVASNHNASAGPPAREILSRVLSEALATFSGTLPDLRAIASGLGVHRIIRRPLEVADGARVDAMLIPTEPGYVVALNQNASEQRQRYSLAHEIGHLVLLKQAQYEGRHDQGQSAIYTRSHSDRKEERLCEEIAAELLMPADLFAQRMSELGYSLDYIATLSDEFRTSITSSAIRYQELLPEPCLLIRWHRVQGPDGGFRTSWQLRNNLPGPSAQVPTGRATRGTSAFVGVQSAWTRSGVQTTHETLMTKVGYWKPAYVRFPQFKTESIGFGKGQRRFVLSAVYLDAEMT